MGQTKLQVSERDILTSECVSEAKCLKETNSQDRYHTLPWQCCRGKRHESDTVLGVWRGHSECRHSGWSNINASCSNLSPACHDLFHNNIRCFGSAILAKYSLRTELNNLTSAASAHLVYEQPKLTYY